MVSFESETEMIGIRMVLTLIELEADFKADFNQWLIYKLVDAAGRIIDDIRYKYDDGIIEVGRLIVHPEY